MPPDSLLIAPAAALFAACIGAWRLAGALRAAARMPLRFAAMLLAAFAVAVVLRLGDVTALLLLPLAGANLALAALARFARPLHTALSTIALMAALAFGLAAMLSGHWMLALAPLAACALVVIAAALNGMAMVPALAGAALLAAGLGLLRDGPGTGTLLFCAAAIVGAARSAAPVQQPRGLRSGGGISGADARVGVIALRHDLPQDLRYK